jgi:hypothetical protein
MVFPDSPNRLDDHPSNILVSSHYSQLLFLQATLYWKITTVAFTKKKAKQQFFTATGYQISRLNLQIAHTLIRAVQSASTAPISNQSLLRTP